MTNKSTFDAKEVEKFSSIAKEWWDENGKFKPLHKFNPVRISYIREKIIEHFDLQKDAVEPFFGLQILDIGCGGGLVTESFAKMGAKVTAIDAASENIEVAKIHAKESGLKIDYRVSLVEDLAKEEKEKFDVVFALEIVEHVLNVEEFIRNAELLLKPNGIMFVATINRNAKSFLFAIVGAEYVLRWLKIGTHSWKKFLKPSEVNEIASKFGLQLQELKGFKYQALIDQFKIDDDLDVNYIALFSK